MKFSSFAHYKAREVLYPSLFSVPHYDLEYENIELSKSERERILDGELGVDRIIKVKRDDLLSKIPFTIQERFKSPKYSHFRELTITKFNHASNKLGELSKLCAGFFVCGYYNKEQNQLLETVIVNVPKLLIAIANNEVDYNEIYYKEKEQSFIAIHFDHLLFRDMVELHYVP